ncbi:uncharacterized protein LOC129599828 [Paramacrobiotus metropolitanus]|uniref:uncharacterized protein LOC129599828 n=1 Tax=Paramacrobiotus metropolitanus TaxID=2943436 RepID=UPI0024456777|nr:uncharacterized protein LOC129599828 [Paramacrobiotus metropolitanus]
MPAVPLDRLRIPVPKEKLVNILPWLEEELPNSLPMYHMACNIVENRFDYPEMKFIVDKLPKPSVCVCKPMRSKTTRGYHPIFNDHLLVYVHAHSVKAFRAMLRCNPELFNWGKDITFIDIHPALAQVFLSMEGRGGFSRVTPEEGCPSGQRVFNFGLESCNLSPLPIPSDLRLGILSPDHVEQIVQECRYTHPSWKKVFRHMLSHGFPSIALYDDNVAQDSRIAYCMYMMHVGIGAVYVQPAYRHRDLFGVVISELLVQLQTHNVPYASVWMQTVNLPLEPQLEVLRGLGGVECSRHNVMCSVTYRAQPDHIDPFEAVPIGTRQQRQKVVEKKSRSNADCPRLPFFETTINEDPIVRQFCPELGEATSRKIRDSVPYGKPTRSRKPERNGGVKGEGPDADDEGYHCKT